MSRHELLSPLGEYYRRADIERRHLEMMAATIAAGMLTNPLNFSDPASRVPILATEVARAIQEEVAKGDFNDD